jgi:hypothetical protein
LQLSYAGDHAVTEDSDKPERPRLEPEIIPPSQTGRGSEWRQRAGRPHVSTMAGETHRIYVGRLGPLGIALVMLIVAILAAIILLALLGAVLLWIPVVALIIAAGAIFRLLRR